MNRIGLIGAMPIEVAPILECLETPSVEFVGPLKFHLGTISGVPVVVGCCGISKVNASMGTQAMIQKYHPQLIIHMGVAGALVDKLKIGDVVIAEGCVQYDVDTSPLGDPVGLVSTVNKIIFECDESVRNAISSNAAWKFSVHRGIVSTGDRFLTKAADKKWISQTFGALTCDQESCAVTQVCFVNGTPVAVVRAISDATSGENADEYENFLPLAAKNAVSVVLGFLEKSGSYFL